MPGEITVSLRLIKQGASVVHLYSRPHLGLAGGRRRVPRLVNHWREAGRTWYPDALSGAADSLPRPATVPVPQSLLEPAHPFVVAGARQGRGCGRGLVQATITATAPSRHGHGAAGGPALPKETAPTCTAGKQGSKPPEEGGAKAGRRGGGAKCGAGLGGAKAESLARQGWGMEGGAE